jgi:hypothetical protein
MRRLNLTNADVTVTSDDISLGTQQMIADVQYIYDQDPAELDLPSGTWWVWPIRRGTLQVSGYLTPGVVPHTIPVDIDYVDIDVACEGHSLSFTDAVLTGMNVSLAQLGEALPALQVQYSYTIFKDDNGVTTEFDPLA